MSHNPFYVEPSQNSCMEEEDLEVMNAFDLRKGLSLIQHLNTYKLHRHEAMHMLSYAWLNLTALDKDESAHIVRQCQRQLENQSSKTFSDINLKEWMPVYSVMERKK